MLKIKLLIQIVFVVQVASVSAQTWKLIQPKYATSDAFVAKYNAVEQGADPTGVTDNTALFQRLLDYLGSRVSSNGGVNNGGVLFIPEGKYKILGQLIIPKGVTIRGEWEKPVKGQVVKGTILMVYYGKGTDHGTSLDEWKTFESKAFITLQPAAAIKDLLIWYPEQDPNSISAYPPSLQFGQYGYFGGSSCNATNITLINSYYGINHSKNNSGASPFIYGIYGTPLSCGIDIDNIGDVGRVDVVDFSPAYWAGSGLANSPVLGGAYSSWIYNNGVGITMRRNDWSNCCFVKVDGYNKGYYASTSISDTTKCANGNHYGSEFSNCKYGVYADRVNVVGQMHTRYKITNCEYGFYLADCKDGLMQILACDISASKSAIYISANTKTKVLMSQCTINQGGVDLIGGVISMTNNVFKNSTPQLNLGSDVRSVITGNTFQEAVQIKNTSKYDNIIDHTPVVMSAVPAFQYTTSDDIKQKPSRMVMYLATDFGVSPSATDNAMALQSALNKAQTDGGGIVFMPPGRYKFFSNLSIPSGVELKGAVDNKCDPQGCGAVFEVYAGKGQSETSAPFISMEPNSGLRGLTFNYPEQLSTLLPNIFQYPYCIRGNANCYIVNTNFRATYKAIDLFSNKCDNHYVEYPAGHVFNVGIRIGGGSTNGLISNAQFNCFPYTWGMQSKCGFFPNSPDPNTTIGKDSIFTYMFRNLQFLILGNCSNQTLYNIFDYGAAKSVILSSIDGTGPSGISMGTGMDAGVKTFCFEAIGTGGFDFINTQIVSIPGPLSDGTNIVANQPLTRYLETSAGFNGKSTFYSADFWGNVYEISNQIQGGNIELQTAHFTSPGRKTFAEIASGAKFSLLNSNLNPQLNVVVNGSLSKFYIQSSIINSTGINKAGCGLWFNNIEPTASVSPNSSAFLPRTGWIATASVANTDAAKAIDGVSTTSWSTLSVFQNSGQWFKVDMLQPKTCTGIYLDVLKATETPVSCTVSVSNDGTNWTVVGAGVAQNQIMFNSSQTTRYIKIEQTGTSTTSPWAIKELYVMVTDVSTPIITLNASPFVVYNNGNRLIIQGTEGKSKVSVYNLSGQLLRVPVWIESDFDINLTMGVYILLVENNKQLIRKKIIVNKSSV